MEKNKTICIICEIIGIVICFASVFLPIFFMQDNATGILFGGLFIGAAIYTIPKILLSENFGK